MIHSCAYTKPTNLEDAVSALHEENARVLAGGTDLLADMRGGIKKTDLVVDIKGIENLNVLSVDSDRGASIGAAVTLNALIESKKLKERYPVLPDAAFTIATYQLRNRATMVGNICNASPAADMAPPLYILGAKVLIAGRNGERSVPIDTFITGVKETILDKGEIVTRVEIPPLSKNSKMVFLKKQRIKGHDLATINIAGLADRGSQQLKICIGACAETPLLLEKTDELYREEKDIEKLAERIFELSLQSISPIDDIRSSAEYRRNMVRIYVNRVLQEICL